MSTFPPATKPDPASSTRPVAPAAPVRTQAPAPTVDPLAAEREFEQMKREQRLGAAVFAGSIAALVSAALWAAITVATEYQIGWMAVGVGALVGVTMRRFGKGVEPTFGFVAAALALFGCLLGNLFAVIGLLSTELDLPFFGTLAELDFEATQALLVATFSPMDLLFYAIAVFEAFKLSFQRAAPAAAIATPAAGH